MGLAECSSSSQLPNGVGGGAEENPESRVPGPVRSARAGRGRQEFPERESGTGSLVGHLLRQQTG